MYRNGVKLDISRVRGIVREADCYGVYGSDGGFIGTAFADFDSGELRIGKNLG
jgi:tRNA pseudouridine55 synthase